MGTVRERGERREVPLPASIGQGAASRCVIEVNGNGCSRLRTATDDGPMAVDLSALAGAADGGCGRNYRVHREAHDVGQWTGVAEPVDLRRCGCVQAVSQRGGQVATPIAIPASNRRSSHAAIDLHRDGKPRSCPSSDRRRVVVGVGMVRRRCGAQRAFAQVASQCELILGSIVSLTGQKDAPVRADHHAAGHRGAARKARGHFACSSESRV